MSKLDDFLTELAALSNKYEMEIAGCGDCGSPWIETYDNVTLAVGLGYVKGENRYEVTRTDVEGPTREVGAWLHE